MDVRVDPHAQINRVHGLFELRLVHLHEVVVALLPVAAKVVPHQVVHHALRHALRAQVARVKRLVAPLDPPGRRRRAVDQAQRAHFLRVRDREPRQHVRTRANAEAHHRLEAKVRQHEQQLLRHLVHRRIGVAGGEFDEKNLIKNKENKI